MKKTTLLIISMALAIILSMSVFAYQGNNMVRGKGYGQQQGGQIYTLYDDTQVNHQLEISNYPVEELSQEETDSLIYMREEEKLARDVYLALYDIYGQQIFYNIAQSEQTHTEAIKLLLEKYDLEDPVSVDERGVFENQELQALYNSLVEQGSQSLLDALTVGATIEDLDIKDLQVANEQADNQDISAVYDNLEKGSRNHIRSFTRMIERNGGTYQAQYITQEEYEQIIASDMERGTQYGSQAQGSQGRNANPQQNSIATTAGTNNQQADVAQQRNTQRSQNAFSRMWDGFKSWFN